MRITREETAKNRDRIVAAGAKLFGEKGFEGVGLAELMQEAGLTHGGFYNHFESKEMLGAAVCDTGFEKAVKRLEDLAGDATTVSRKRTAVADYIKHYLSNEARDAPAPRCPMVALTSDAARHGPNIRRRFAFGLKRYIDALARLMGRSEKAARAEAERFHREAITLVATLVGAQLLARAVKDADATLSDDILAAVHQSVARQRA